MDFVEQLKSSLDIVRVVGEYVRLKKAGAGPRYTGLCPFHNEKTPSFGVHSVHQYYKCFGCDAKGDMINFVMQIEGLTFFEALKLLSERYGIPMPRRADYSDAQSKARATLYEMHEVAARIFSQNLASAQGLEARAYLAKRGVTPAIAEEFGLGLAERSWDSLLRHLAREGFTAEQAERAGLAGRRDDGSAYDRFRGRLIFPIHNESGKVIAFGGRALDPGVEPKYLNSPKTEIYDKSQTLYNLNRAKSAIRKHEASVLVEGYMDVIGVWSAGVGNVVASCGTALVAQQVRALRRHADRIIVNFDPDTAGTAATERSIQMLLDEHMHVRILELEAGLDPDEYVKQHGVDAYQERLVKAVGYFYWLADRARARFDLRSAEGRVAGFQFLLPAIQRIGDKIERAAVANDVAGYLGVDSGLVLEQFRKSAVERRQPGAMRAPPPELPMNERLLLESVIGNEEVRREVLPLLRELPLDQLASRRILENLVALEDRFSFAALEARLEDGDKALLTSVVFADEVSDDAIAREQALACIQKLEAGSRACRRASLKERVKAAERVGDLTEALRLTDELNRLERR
jgi:DNA primase